MISEWHIITIGNLSRNRFWGESDEVGLRAAFCTSTLIVSDGRVLLVDPAWSDADRMAFDLDRRTGKRLDDVDAIFITHSHGDHHEALDMYTNAQLLAAAAEAQKINESGRHARQVEPAGERIWDDLSVIATPGHTPDHHSLLFECRGLAVVVAGDAAMRRDFWEHRQGYFNSWDFDVASKTIEELTRIADVIVPGHDNYFLTRRPGSPL